MSQSPLDRTTIPPAGHGLLSIVVGATYPLRALWLFLKTPRLRRYILIPILINIVIGVTLYATLLFAGLSAIDQFISNVPIWIAQLSQISESLPQVGLPNQIANLPHWNVHFPHVSLPNLTTYLPHWNIPLPHWQIQFPQIQFPAVRVPNGLMQWLSTLSSEAIAFSIWLLRLALSLVLLLATGFVLLQFGVLLGAPWYGKLSEELEKLRTGQLRTIEVSPFQEVSRAIGYEAKKLVITIGLGLPLLLLNFFPGVGTLVASVGGVLLAATIVCLDFLDSAVERRRPRFRAKLGMIGRSLPASGSFGLVCLGLVSIPFVNLLAIPICVAAGTLFFCDRILPQIDSKLIQRDALKLRSE
ncbi:MAG TPA: EI24 domain-containing protein [Trichocoleus sp.]|jgi:CysZ protein